MTVSEKMISTWWSKSTGPIPHACEEWFHNSYKDPELFWKDLFSVHDKSKRSSVKSIYGKQYDFYHDCIIRHLYSNPLAYTYVGKTGKENWSYQDIHECVNYHLDKWVKFDLHPNQMAALVVSSGPAKVIALFAAMRLGMRICFLPHGTELLAQKYIEEVLTSLLPDVIITDLTETKLHDQLPHLLIDHKGRSGENYAPHSFAYPALNVVQTTLALHRQEALCFVPLDAQTMYLHPMRDYLLGLNLLENSSWSTPLMCPLRSEPCSTLMTHLAGARKVDVVEGDLKEDPQLLKNEKIQLLGVSLKLQSLWTQFPGGPKSLEACFKIPYDMNYYGWRGFILANKLERVAAYHLLLDNSMGGAISFSKPQVEAYDLFLKCSPGVSWMLTDFEDSSVSSGCGMGYFKPELALDENSEAETNLIFSEVNRSCSVTGSKDPCRDGFRFPVEEVERVVNGLPFVEICMVLPVIKVAHPFDYDFILLIFVDPIQKLRLVAEKATWEQEVRRSIEVELGTGYLPNQLKFYPLLPRIKSDGIDRVWCTNQYNAGLLNKKVESPSYQILHCLYKLVEHCSD